MLQPMNRRIFKFSRFSRIRQNSTNHEKITNDAPISKSPWYAKNLKVPFIPLHARGNMSQNGFDYSNELTTEMINFAKRAELPENLPNLVLALTHRSFASGKFGSNERLRWIGAETLRMCVDEHLIKTFPSIHPSVIDYCRSLYTNRSFVHYIGRSWYISKSIRVLEWDAMSLFKKIDVVSDCTYAIIGAIYGEHGYTFTKDFVVKWFFKHRPIWEMPSFFLESDFKTTRTLTDFYSEVYGQTPGFFGSKGVSGEDIAGVFVRNPDGSKKTVAMGQGVSKEAAVHDCIKNGWMSVDKVVPKFY